MLSLAGYKFDTAACVAQGWIWYAGTRLVDGQAVLARVYDDEFPQARHRRELTRQAELAKSLTDPLFPKLIELAPWGNGLALITILPIGESLAKLIPGCGYPLEVFGHIMRSLGHGLKRLHERGLMHGHVEPGSFFLDPATCSTTFVHYGVACSGSDLEAGDWQANPAYLAPELIGGHGLRGGVRSDLYALGILAYQLLTGRMPFSGGDLLGLVQNHLRETPAQPHQFNPNIPRACSDLVNTLMAKDPEQRYQQIDDALADLDALEIPGQTWPSPRLEKDAVKSLIVPDGLYGRDLELKRLQSVWLAAGNSRQLVWLSGPGGIGKTALVEAFQKDLPCGVGLFLRCKFSIEGGSEHSLLVDLLAGLAQNLEQRPEPERVALIQASRHRMGEDFRLLLDLSPQLCRLLGEAAPGMSVDMRERLVRSFWALQDLLQSVAKAGSPLLIFLDDLQWSGDLALKLIQFLMNEAELSPLMLVCAFRDGEPPDGCDRSTVETMLTPRPGDGTTAIPLGPISVEAAVDWLGEALERAPGHEQLAARLHKLAEGNPFFLEQYLLRFYQSGGLFHQWVWRWDEEGLDALEMLPEMTALLLDRLNRLAEALKRILQTLACLGGRCQTRHLELALGSACDDMNAELCRLEAEHLVLRRSDAVCFSHDRVLESVKASIPDLERPSWHRGIGERLREGLSGDERDGAAVLISDQLNRGGVHGLSSAERLVLAELNLRAGEQLRTLLDLPSAMSHLQIGLDLLGTNSWDTAYNLSYHGQMMRVECQFMTGDLESVLATSQLILSQAQTPLHKAMALSLRMVAVLNTGQPGKMIQEGLEALRLLGFFPGRRPSILMILGDALRLLFILHRRPIESLAKAPADEDPAGRLMARIAQDILIGTAYEDDFLTRIFLILRTSRIALERGPVGATSFCLIFHAVLLQAGLGRFKAAQRFAETALQIDQRGLPGRAAGYAEQYYALFSMPWNQHWRELAPAMEKAVTAAVHAGYFTDFVFGYLFIHQWDPNLSLGELAADREGICKMTQGMQYVYVFEIARFRLAYCYNLMGKTANRQSLDFDDFNEERYRIFCGSVFRLIETDYLLTRMQLKFLYDDLEGGLALVQLPMSNKQAILGSLYHFEYSLYAFLICARLLPKLRGRDRCRARFLMRREHRQMRRWARHCPLNFSHFLDLFDAEAARVSGRSAVAARLYDRAIKGAHDYPHLRYEALMTEIAGRFHLEQGAEQAAAAYLRQASYLYERWGALAKSKQMEEVYGRLCRRPKINRIGGDDDRVDGVNLRETLDAFALAKASQAIAEELDPDRLPQRILSIILAHAGAQDGALILLRDKDLLVWDGDAPRSICEHPWINCDLVHRVFDSGQELIVDDARSDPELKDLVGGHRTSLRSLLLMPIRGQDGIHGLLYLENRHLPGVFSPGLARILKVLLGQATISLANADLLKKESLMRQQLELEMARGQRVRDDLAVSEARFRAMVEQTSDLIWETDDAMRFSYISPLSQALFGRPDDEVLGHSPLEFMSDACLREKGALLHELILEHRPIRSMRLDFHHRDGPVLSFDVSAVPIFDDCGRFLGYRGINRDLSEQIRRDEDERLWREKLAISAKMASLGTMASGVAHEVNNPTNLIMLNTAALDEIWAGMSPILAERLADPEPPSVRALSLRDVLDKVPRLLKGVRGAAGRIKNLSRELRDFARREPIALRNGIDLNRVVTTALDLVGPAVHEASDRFTLSLADDLPPIRGHHQKLEQLVVNLLQNAAQALTERSQGIGLVTRYQAEAAEVCLEVHDEGRGIPAEIRSRLGEPFFTTRRDTGGSGLGLSLVNAIVHSHGGRLEIDSTPEKGTRMVVHLPVQNGREGRIDPE